jgi:hypothetical protein
MRKKARKSGRERECPIRKGRICLLRSHRYVVVAAGPTRMLTGRSETKKKQSGFFRLPRAYSKLLESKKVKAPMGISLDRITSVEGGTDGTDSPAARVGGPISRSRVKIGGGTMAASIDGAACAHVPAVASVRCYSWLGVFGWSCCATLLLLLPSAWTGTGSRVQACQLSLLLVLGASSSSV